MLLFRLTPGLLPSPSPLPPLFKNRAKSNLVFCVVLLISALPLLTSLLLFILTNWKKTFHYFFVVKYLCNDLTLHQFSCLFLDFLISKIELSKWCDLRLVSASGILHREGSHPVGIALALVWDVFSVMKTPSDSWRMLCAVKFSPWTSWTNFFQSWVSKGQPDNLPSALLLLVFFFWMLSLLLIVWCKVNFCNLSCVLITYAQKWRL